MLLTLRTLLSVDGFPRGSVQTEAGRALRSHQRCRHQEAGTRQRPCKRWTRGHQEGSLGAVGTTFTPLCILRKSTCSSHFTGAQQYNA